jgi:hypothetical protein
MTSKPTATARVDAYLLLPLPSLPKMDNDLQDLPKATEFLCEGANYNSRPLASFSKSESTS